MSQTPAIKFGTIILAAGRSSRMGQPKMLLPWGKTSVLGHSLSQWQRLRTAQLVVVHGPDSGVARELDRLNLPAEQRIKNAVPEDGMFSSIRCAAQWEGWSKHLTHWAIVLGDQPHVLEETLEALVQFASNHAESVCQPEWKGRPKHPVVLPKKDFLELRSTKAADLKEFLTGRAVALIKSDDPGLDFDLDYPQDYERAKRLYLGTH